MIRTLIAALATAGGLTIAALALRCQIGWHTRPVWQFVGSSWNPDLYVQVCARCGQEAANHHDLEPHNSEKAT